MHGVFPVQPCAKSAAGGPVREVFAALEDGHEREQHRRERRLAFGMVAVGEIFITILRIEGIADQLVEITVSEVLGTPGGDLGWHLAGRLWLQDHRTISTYHCR